MARGRRSKDIEAFAEDLGRLLGTAQAKAEGWLGQRQLIAKQLMQIRDTASGLLAQLASGRARKEPRGVRGIAENLKRKLSPAARKAISDAQKRRWAAFKAGKK